ncbi:MAG: bifunctional alpha,alpha-trehalose-phosphate synthase (UDP-forming)/trehalose-phosphatase [Bacillota bacterium]|nr:bifunctional alpha,alpha-trehalose-phosphate synthase (UDP-forming)/trehalose-phosphatase [Bacillota bacterium]
MISPGSDFQDRRAVIVSNRLPVTVTRKGGIIKVAPSVGGLATGLSSFHRSNDGLWVGWPGFSPGSQAIQEETEEILRNEQNCVPVYLSASDLKKYYNGFSNGTLWPLFHYFTTYCSYKISEWEAYKKVNQMFCRRLKEVVQPDDMVWIHDYHLLLLPELLRREVPDVTIGFFLHIPFPSMEIFRQLPWREEILNGMLGADLIGFHTYDYTRHFLSCLLRILGKEQSYGKLVVDNRMITVDTFPMGIDTEKFASASASPAVSIKKEHLLKKVKTEKIILSVDRLDFSKGIPERLKAFELFLDQYPQWQGRVTFIMLCVPSRTKVREYRMLKSEIDELVGRINGRFDTLEWLPILYMYRSLPFEELVSLYTSADLALVTPLRDGMNLVAKEYLACQSHTAKGALVLSETAGSAAELGEAILVNPNDLEMMAGAIARGLSLTDEEKKYSIDTMVDRLNKYNIYRWAEDFITTLTQTKENQVNSKQRFMVRQYEKKLQEKYQLADRRLLLLDYDGTLTSIRKRPDLANPDAELIELLAGLKNDSKNTVVIISGRDRETLTRWLSETGVDLVAEHGTWLRESSWESWKPTIEGLTDDWKQNVRPILDQFSIRTPGSFIEEKAHALVWHYRKSDPALGDLRAKELNDALHDILSGTDLQALPGRKVLEIKPVGVNKGRAAQHWLEKADIADSWDFILAMGDDLTDEDIFSIVPEYAWSIKVGLASYTRAGFFLESPDQTRKLLQNLEKS